MKLTRIITSLVLLTVVLALSVGAVEFVPSIEIKDAVRLVVSTNEDDEQTIGKIYDENGEFVRDILLEELLITPLWHLDDGEIEVHNEIEQTLSDAKNELFAEDWHQIIPNFAEVWAEVSDGAPIENAVISDLFDVRYDSVVDGFITGLLVEGHSATFNIVVDGITKDTPIVVGHKPSDTGKWVLEDYTISDDNVITISVESLSPFFIATDSTAAPEADPNAPDSPKTGVSELSITCAAAVAVLMLGAAILCVIKLRKVSAR